jgi:PPK2 family polyphosphate:nucleotide phosphotransferase
MKFERLIAPHRVARPGRFRLADVDPGGTDHIEEKSDAEGLLQQGVARLAELQEMLYAQDRWSVLLIFQALDAAGKDGTIKHVLSGVNPAGCQVHSFKQPSAEELDHDYLWRCSTRLPQRGRIGIFNRSYYEEVLVVRVHEEILAGQKLPPRLVTPRIWNERFEDINAYERYLARNGTVIRKFFLHVSKEEQRRRFLARIDEGEKNWKFSLADAQERVHWDAYQRAYEDAIRHTSTPHAPWFVIPADHKWYTRTVVAAAIVAAIEELEVAFPKVGPARRAELQRMRRVLAADGRKGGKRGKGGGKARRHKTR